MTHDTTQDPAKIKPLLIDIPMPIETQRLVLRAPQTGDGLAMYEAKEETWEQLNTWLYWARKKSTPEEDELTMREGQIEFLARKDLMMLICDRDTGRLLGATGLHRFDWLTRCFEIGYWVRRSAQGQGYVTESTKALIRYAFDELKANRVSICHAEGNQASEAAIKKCGFIYEGTRRRSDILPDGSMTDNHWYYLLDADHLGDFPVSWGRESQG